MRYADGVVTTQFAVDDRFGAVIWSRLSEEEAEEEEEDAVENWPEDDVEYITNEDSVLSTSKKGMESLLSR